MSDKLRNWSEGHNRASDSVHGLGDGHSDDVVEELVAARGVVLLTNCQHCGRQWKGVVLWPEVADYYLLNVRRASDGGIMAKYTKQGVLALMPCNGCHKKFDVIIDYDEVRKWVNAGVRSGCLNPQIHEAARARGIRH